jgi:hypothetical protein
LSSHCKAGFAKPVSLIRHKLPEFTTAPVAGPAPANPRRHPLLSMSKVMALDHSCQVQRHTLVERQRDEYDTPAPALRALLRVESLGPAGTRILEPCAGKGNLVLPLRAAGFEVIASDISDRGCPDCAIADFFDLVQLPVGCDILLTNPPFYCVEQFVRHALSLRPRRLVLLLRLAFMEARRRTDILENTGLARIHVFDRRLPMMHRASWTGKKANSGMAFAWFTWECDYRGPTTIDRIRWDQPEQ